MWRAGHARPRPVLVDGRGSDLLRRARGLATLAGAGLDVLVLPFALVAPLLLWHGNHLRPGDHGVPSGGVLTRQCQVGSRTPTGTAPSRPAGGLLPGVGREQRPGARRSTVDES